MSHKTPKADCSCCAPCTPPIVTCDLVGGDFEYTVENASQAWLETYNPGNIQGVDPPDVSTEVTLTDGAASGSITSAGAGYNYCIRAISDCGEALCCSPCPAVICSIAYRFIGLDYETVYFDWVVESDTGAPITYAAIDGNIYLSDPDAGGNAFRWSGTLSYTLGSTVPSQICIMGRNDCNAECETCFNVPCCWRVDDLVIEISDAGTYVQECSLTPKQIEIEGSLYYQGEVIQESTVTVNGLSGLNGTHMFSLTGRRRVFGIPSIYHGFCWGGNDMATGVLGNVVVNHKIYYVPCCLYTDPVDECGNSWYGVLLEDTTTTFSGEFYFVIDEFGLSIELHVTNVKIKRRKFREVLPGNNGPCVNANLLACTGIYSPDPDPNYCLYDGPPGVGTGTDLIGIAIYSASYGCDEGVACDSVDDFCQMKVLPAPAPSGTFGLCQASHNPNTHDLVCNPSLEPTSFGPGCVIGYFGFRTYYD